ncbi:MAG: lipid-A-disaccharide synthase [Parvularculaceae bacterium]
MRGGRIRAPAAVEGTPLRILLAAVEPSGDGLGAALLQSLRKQAPPNTEYFGCGGPLMEREGFQSLFAIDSLSVMGFSEVVRALPLGFRRAKDLAQLAARKQADIAVFIDGWAFSRVGAKRLRQYSPRTAVYKFAAPQVWASRPKRVDFVRRYFSGVLTLLPFEPAYFKAVGVRAKFVGNPNFQAAWAARGDGAAFRRRYELGQDTQVLAVLLGSRISEFRRLEPRFRETVERLRARLPNLAVIALLAPSITEAARHALEGWPTPPMFIGAEEKYDAFAGVDAALAVSGTVTTELAINATPMIIAYRVDPLTAFWARRVMTTPFASVLNFAAGRAVIPEFLQENCTPDAMADALETLLTDEEARRAQCESFRPLLEMLELSGPSAADRAARTILSWIADDDDL